MTESYEFFLFISLLLAGFYMAWNIGANDVANAMGTSVGSHALTLRQAVWIAAVLEFSGAFFFGSHVSETIQKGIVDLSFFENKTFDFVLGMLSVLLATGAWLQLASYYGWPVSTTHSVVGALIGFGAMIGGVDAVHWANIFYIMGSWVFSPLLGGIVSYGIFSILRRTILFNEDPLGSTLKWSPFFFFLLSFAPFSAMGLRDLKTCYSGFIFSCMAALIGYGFLKIWIKTFRVHKRPFFEVEKVFAVFQVITACLMAFAHGANDVANAIGPLAAAFKMLPGFFKENTDIYLQFLGGVGIVVGLATWGFRVIETIGKKITELTPSRGFSAEFGAALTILFASRLGLPISTTHTLVGSVIGVGLARGLEAINLQTTRDIFLSWLVTIPAGAILSVVFYCTLKFFL